ncbi:MAG: hypothetical protein N3A65_07410 [candidate division WOR-3 bacterium]|nr:hypothetical protein [candidate division WOR-3 bacterium]
MKIINVFFIFANILLAGNFIFNGNFEDSLNFWNCYAHGETYTIHTDKMYEIEDSDSEVYVGKLDKMLTAVSQTCYIPGLELTFSFKAKLFAKSYDTLHPHPAIASLILSYLDIDENILGETRIFYYAESLYWQPSPNLHLIEISDTNWFCDTINILDELQNLPGINPSDISKLRIILYSRSYGC